MEQVNTAQQNDLVATLIQLEETKKSSKKSQKRLEEAMEKVNKQLEEAMEKVNKQNELALTVDQIQEQGRKVLAILTAIETLNGYANLATLTASGQESDATKLQVLEQFAEVVYSQTILAIKVLDVVGVTLSNCDDEKILNEFGLV